MFVFSIFYFQASLHNGFMRCTVIQKLSLKVPKERLELSCTSATVSKTVVSAIPPLRQVRLEGFKPSVYWFVAN